jgi:predicted DNA-binding protein (MmcQ/YjbR family)
MSLHSTRAFMRHVGSLKAVEVVEQWESHVAKVGGKVFALIGASGDGIVFKVSETSFEGLTALAEVRQAPYFAKRGWVRVGRGAPLSDAELKAYIAAAHQMVAAKLTRKLRAELGLAP